MVKASHAFNLLDARHAVSVTERQRFILRVRTLARGVAESYRASREALGFPLHQEQGRGARGRMSAHDLLFELAHRGAAAAHPARLCPLRSREGVRQGVDSIGIPHGEIASFCDAAAPRRAYPRIWPSISRIEQVERRGPPLKRGLRCARRADSGRHRFRQELRRGGAGARPSLRPTKARGCIYRGTERGAATVSLLGDIVNQAVAALPIAKRMRWGSRTAEFVRPVHACRSALRRMTVVAGRGPRPCNRAHHVRPSISRAQTHFAQVGEELREPIAARQSRGGFQRSAAS